MEERAMSTGCRRCSHERVAHLHYRAGTDCALCGCSGFTRRLLGLMQRVRPTDRPRARLMLVAVDGVRVA
jgi:hypothetical protein